jgi:hypothetical protein
MVGDNLGGIKKEKRAAFPKMEFDCVHYNS